MKRKVLFAIGILLLAFVAIQFVPVERTNPPASAPFNESDEVMAVLRNSCFDCHSSETVWPWYSYVAPVSWLVAKDVREGRGEFSFSEWGGYPPEKQGTIREKAYSEGSEGGMPLPGYLKMHPQARLSKPDIAVLRAWCSPDAIAAEADGGEGDEAMERPDETDAPAEVEAAAEHGG
jgi:hypothetical protein